MVAACLNGLGVPANPSPKPKPKPKPNPNPNRNPNPNLVPLPGLGVPARQIESWDLGLTTCSTYGDASVLDSCWADIKENMAAIPAEPWTVGVITGFIGKDASGSITTLGRGGSDLTASLVGAAAGFDEVQVWKDVAPPLTQP